MTGYINPHMDRKNLEKERKREREREREIKMKYLINQNLLTRHVKVKTTNNTEIK